MEVDIETMESLINFDIMLTLAKKFIQKKSLFNPSIFRRKKRGQRKLPL
ncbi:hypothetical protein NF865_09825 [Thermococcus aggregans]|uniref:Uncharacterized protein n=1 Tax=Thermococcus aggregans TaxID=110163 RepID=A0A9E7MX66_THEAG|nr:hypothetical protein [Thermococcus aggregans]USS40578.1 hypothetical protein NF865_09825 [Thermococcus aggregans]